MSEAENIPAVSDDGALRAYIRQVVRHRLLSPEEEAALTKTYAETRSPRASARLVTANLRLVVKIAYEYKAASKHLLDLIQEGNIGLMKAVERFDPNRGVRLSSYAAWWIRAYILRFILNNWHLVKLGTTQAQRKLFFNLKKEKAKLLARGVDPSPAHIAAQLGVDEADVVEMDLRLSLGETSLDTPIGEDDGETTRKDLLAADGPSSDAMLMREQERDVARKYLASIRMGLRGTDVVIFDRRIVAEEPLTLQELGDQFGISRERVRQLEARLLSRIKREIGDRL